jgi:hypothetical protein
VGEKMRFTTKSDLGKNKLVLIQNPSPLEPNQGEWVCDTDKTGKYHTFHGEFVDKLADYEDLEEQGLLLRLPCRIGGTVYHYCEESGRILEYVISYVGISNYVSGGFNIVIGGSAFEDDCLLDDFEDDMYSFQKEFFQTFEEAKQALEEIRNVQ